jgi:hypothetical protein
MFDDTSKMGMENKTVDERTVNKADEINSFRCERKMSGDEGPKMFLLR